MEQCIHANACVQLVRIVAIYCFFGAHAGRSFLAAFLFGLYTPLIWFFLHYQPQCTVVPEDANGLAVGVGALEKPFGV